MAVPPADSNGRNTITPLQAGLAYLRAGLSVIPIRADGSKAPASAVLPWVQGDDGKYRPSWKSFQQEIATQDEVEAWLDSGRFGLAVVCGAVSGSAELIDFDQAELFAPWGELVEAQAPGLADRLTVVKTPCGYHVWYRCTDTKIPGNQKLAEGPVAHPSNGKPGRGTLIETRGEGGYALVPGCPPACHETSCVYEHHSGPPLVQLTDISAEQREVLLGSARAFNLAVTDDGRAGSPDRFRSPQGARPGDAYNERGPEWGEILDGWECVRTDGAVCYWRRPGKQGRAWSATTGRCKGPDGRDLLYVFSSNAYPFEPNQSYSKFAAVCLLHHGGDYQAAARALAEQGYGEARHRCNGVAGPRPSADSATPVADGKPERVTARPVFAFISSADFARTTYDLQWLVKRLLVKGQPGILGGPKKSLKTSLLVDLALSLGTGQPFLGHFAVYRTIRVAVMSGESGQATLKETALRVCQAKGVDLASANVVWEFQLPQLADVLHLAALKEALEAAKAEVLLIDPLYLCILAGVRAQGNAAANVFQMGPLYASIAQTCLSVGCTPVLAHHFKITRADPYGEPQLEDLAFAGVQEFARQWFLVGRRERYGPGTGFHKLWLTVGGSAGQSGLWSLDVDEGVIDEDFRGRKWEVTIAPASDARSPERARRAEEQQRQDSDDDSTLMGALDRLDPNGQGVGRQKVMDESGLSRGRLQRAVTRMREEGLLEEIPVKVRVGNGAERSADGLRRRASDGGI